jgi:hypothetical protein
MKINNVELIITVSITEKWPCLCSVLITFLANVYRTKLWPVQQGRKRTQKVHARRHRHRHTHTSTYTYTQTHTNTHEMRGTSEPLVNKRYPMGEAFIICLYNREDFTLYALSSYVLALDLYERLIVRALRLIQHLCCAGRTELAAAGAAHKLLRFYKQTKLAKAAASIKPIEAWIRSNGLDTAKLANTGW